MVEELQQLAHSTLESNLGLDLVERRPASWAQYREVCNHAGSPPRWVQNREAGMVTMRVLAACFEQVGCTEVSTYIQSGNVIFTAPWTRTEAPETSSR